MASLKAWLVAGVLAAAVTSYVPQCNAQVRLWGTFYGGTEEDAGKKVAVDSSGNTYVVGHTFSTSGIVTPDGFDTTFDAELQGYLAKFDTNGQLQWATYLGDSANAQTADIKVDARDNIYVVGSVTCPSNDLATPGHDITCQGHNDTFLMRFNSQGNRVWGTYFGGTGTDIGEALSVSPSGDIYIIGNTSSAQGVAPLSSVDSTLAGTLDTFVVKFNALGQFQWSRYFGGTGVEYGVDIACRPPSAGLSDVCYITGLTDSVAGVATAGAHDTTINTIESKDTYLARLQGSNGKTIWSTYFGGNRGATATALVVDSNLNVYIGGYTLSESGISTAGTHDPTWNGGYDMFMAKFSFDGAREKATYFGNSASSFWFQNDQLLDLAIDAGDNIYLVGWTEGISGIATPNAFDTTFSGTNTDTLEKPDAVLAKFNSGLVRVWATYYGGNSYDGLGAGGIAVDKNNHVYATGDTSSTNAMSTVGSHQISNKGAGDSFLVEFLQ